MAELRCAVDNCAYNRSKCCCKGDIMVGGKRACCEDETCCESFAQTGETALPVQLNTQARSLASTVKRQTVSITAITSARQTMWISKGAEPVTAGRLPVLPLQRDNCLTG